MKKAIISLLFLLPSSAAAYQLGGQVQEVEGKNGDALAVISTATINTSIVDPLPAGTNNIGDVDVLTLPALPAGANNIGTVNVEPGVDALPIVSTGTVNVGDGGGSLTIDATQLDVDDLTFATDKVDASGSTLGANDGVDIGDVTINNANIPVIHASSASVNVEQIKDAAGDALDINADGSINVLDSSIPTNVVSFSSGSIATSSPIEFGKVGKLFIEALGGTCTFSVEGISHALAKNNGRELDYGFKPTALTVEVTAQQASADCDAYGTRSP